MKKIVGAAIVLLAAFSAMPAYAANITEADRTALHAVMLQHIDRQVVDGMYLRMDLKGGNIEQFAPAKAHPMMFTMGENYVLCTDFKDKDGKTAMVDFYVAKRGKSYAVFQTEINNRDPLMKLMETGKVKSVD
jgi:hypothetical protein